MGRRSSTADEKIELQMTPMIDVVFQLLIFFIVTMKPVDVIGRLDVFRPQHDTKVDKDELECLRITVLPKRFMLNQREMRLETLDKNLRRAAERSLKQTVLIQCAEASNHGSLVAVLDLCAKYKLTGISVVTLPSAGSSGGG